MKKTIIQLSVIAFVLLPFLMNAQSPMDKVYEKYAGQEGFTSVNISKDLFQMFCNMDTVDKSSDSKEIRELMQQLTGLKILTYTGDSTKTAKRDAVYNEFNALFPNPVYKEIMSVKEKNNDVRFLTKQDKNGKISEMVMLQKGSCTTVVLSLTGNIDLKNISKLSKTMNIKGLENLDHMKDQKKK